MDLALGGPYCSKFLLMCIFALAGRNVNPETHDMSFASTSHDKGEGFLLRAKQLLVNELGETKPRIPTIQGLLILGGRQCAVGKSSEGWIFTGLAIRMLTDIGLHLPIHDHERLTAAELECRKRLYLSAYVWDKSLSLSLGRPPALTHLSVSVQDLCKYQRRSTALPANWIDVLRR